jgi:hypothetical protein
MEPTVERRRITGALLHRAWLKSGRPDPLLDDDAWDGFALTVSAVADIEAALAARQPADPSDEAAYWKRLYETAIAGVERLGRQPADPSGLLGLLRDAEERYERADMEVEWLPWLADYLTKRGLAVTPTEDAVTVISREKPHNHNVNECHDCYALTHRPRPATPTEERLDAEPSRLDEVGDDRNPYIERTRERVAWEEGWQAYHAALASTEGERTLARPPRTYPCPSCGEVGDHSIECTEGERTDG